MRNIDFYEVTYGDGSKDYYDPTTSTERLMIDSVRNLNVDQSVTITKRSMTKKEVEDAGIEISG